MTGLPPSKATNFGAMTVPTALQSFSCSKNRRIINHSARWSISCIMVFASLIIIANG